MAEAPIRIVKPKDWSELQKALFDYDWGLTAPERHRSPFAYRGLSEDYPDLKTRLMRLGGPYLELERAILRNFRKYAETKEHHIGDSEWLWWAIAQHHGLPTRLLDWTYSPYVALHFATANIEKASKDGVIWCVNYILLRKFLPKKLKRLLKKDQGYKFTVDLLAKGEKGLEGFKALEEVHGKPFVVFLEPPSLDGRIVNQYALFSIVSNAKTSLNELLADHPEACRKIIIPAKLKWEIRDNLDQSNINERMLFPGLDGLCDWLTRYYSPRESKG